MVTAGHGRLGLSVPLRPLIFRAASRPDDNIEDWGIVPMATDRTKI
jgi:hypothetical protein